MARRSRIIGVNKLRRKFRRMPDDVTSEVRSAIVDSADIVRANALAGVPVDQGDLQRSIDYVISRDGLTTVIGPGVRKTRSLLKRAKSLFGATKLNMQDATKHDLMQFFKGYWIEFGTKGSARRNVPAQPARPFMTPAYLVSRFWIKNRVKGAVARALRKAMNR